MSLACVHVAARLLAYTYICVHATMDIEIHIHVHVCTHMYVDVDACLQYSITTASVVFAVQFSIKYDKCC